MHLKQLDPRYSPFMQRLLETRQFKDILVPLILSAACEKL